MNFELLNFDKAICIVQTVRRRESFVKVETNNILNEVPDYCIVQFCFNFGRGVKLALNFLFYNLTINEKLFNLF